MSERSPETTLDDIGPQPGYVGAFTRNQYPSAIPNGTRIVKVKVDRAGDVHPIGSKGVVLGSTGHPSLNDIGYFIEWDDSPRLATLVVGWKIAREVS